jgi:hypothetical protein
VFEDEQTVVFWLPLAVVAIPDLYYGALTGKGNSMERLDRNLFRNLVAAAERDGLLVDQRHPRVQDDPELDRTAVQQGGERGKPDASRLLCLRAGHL